MCKSMHHFSTALRSDIDKSGCYGTASPLVRWPELHWCPTALFSSPERSAAGMDLQDKCGWVCARESSSTKRPFQQAEGMEKVSIIRTSNQSKTKAHMRKIPSLWLRNCIFSPLLSNKKLFHIQTIVLHKEIVITLTFRGFWNVLILQHYGSLYCSKESKERFK